MISIFPSERMAPAQGPSAAGPKPAPEQANTAKPSAFASMMSKDEQGSRGTTEMVAAPSEIPAQSKPPTDLVLIDPDVSEGLSAEVQADAETTNTAGTGKQTDPAIGSGTDVKLAEADIPQDQASPRPPLDRAALEADGPTMRQTLIDQDAQTKLNTAAPESTAMSRAGSPQAEVDPDLAAKAKPESAVTPESRKDLTVGKSGTVLSDVPAERSVSDDVQLLRQTRGDYAQLPGEEGLRMQRGRSDAVAVPPELKDIATRSVADASAGTEKSLLAGQKVNAVSITPDAPISFSDTILSVGPSASAPNQAAPTGLIPTQPAVLIAAPNDITSIIVNNIKNLADPQDQVIVQLDPPELGRVSIDFKFDAQGVQQITITTENPEALKRLRELHFELTSALRENGLSEKNMSFRQHADDQARPGWKSHDRYPDSGSSTALVDLMGPAPMARERTTIASTNRLDLTL